MTNKRKRSATWHMLYRTLRHVMLMAELARVGNVPWGGTGMGISDVN